MTSSLEEQVEALKKIKVEAVDFFSGAAVLAYKYQAQTIDAVLKLIRADAERQKAERGKLAEELRAATAYPFDPSRKMSNKARYEEALSCVGKIASRLEAEAELQEESSK